MQKFFSGNEASGSKSYRWYRLLSVIGIAAALVVAAGVDDRSLAQSGGVGANKTGQPVNPQHLKDLQDMSPDALKSQFMKLNINDPNNGPPDLGRLDKARKKLRDQSKKK